ncbi:hypothetical protein DYB37_000248 [Aphanomyces astaci]|uniref:Uncharacterized protein n=1 Tax=Aphanomyces astaci TaxID=112090 RepID=A0A418F3R3_APHAT|nr:hypothetical protein DYB35_001320 [Aphanomyces astaci]RHZ23371.1 hypothetical protein DYB37_000248 [Aphanomyces astaci]
MHSTKCNVTVQRALECANGHATLTHYSALSDDEVLDAGEADIAIPANGFVGVEAEIPSSSEEPTTTRTPPPRLVRTNAGVYDTDDMSPPSTPHVSLKPFPPKVALETVNHLMFVIHGIGAHTDFEDTHDVNFFADVIPSDKQRRGKSHLLKELFGSTQDTYLASYVNLSWPHLMHTTRDIPLVLEIQTIA